MDLTVTEVWEACRRALQGEVDPDRLELCFERLRPVAVEDDGAVITLTVAFRDRYSYEELQAVFLIPLAHHLLEEAVARVLGSRGRVAFEAPLEGDEGRELRASGSGHSR